ncbi:hypothetical protein AK830_g11936 [Neonectria ditissima]|uniref:Uncharacterized protein n=1 Tax=Neonectria ditissima TaxID=78410 RepID=A0A0P7B1F4_9HYPO|nr:hypothetical protein AK830_g11936 [Neonectria ditissima]
MNRAEIIDISSDSSSPFSPDEDLPQLNRPARLDPRAGVLANCPRPNENGLEFTLELSSLEQSAPRRYIRMALVLPWNQQDGILQGQLDEVHRTVCDALAKTIQHWPFLGGVFRPSTEDSSMLMLKYPRHMSQQLLTRLVEIQGPVPGELVCRNGDYNLSMKNFGRDRFVWDADPEDEDPTRVWFPPVTIKISFVDGTVVLGFAFSENIFDGEFIKNFFAQFVANANHVFYRSFRVENRSMPDEFDGEADVGFFPFYDWSRNPLERRTPRVNLDCRVITLSNDIVQDLHNIVASDNITGSLYEDTVLALFWVTIMRARYENNRFHGEETARVNYTIPGAWYTRDSRRNDPQYCGNSTITAVTICDAQDLIGAPDDPADGLPHMMRLDDFTHAAQLLRSAVNSVDANTLRHFRTFKKTADPDEEREAYDRAIRRHSDTLTFEDWSCYGPDYAPDIPFAWDRVSYLFPCYDHIQEGTVILLPRKGQYWGNEDWSICVCLIEADMDGLLHHLNREGWLLRN